MTTRFTPDDSRNMAAALNEIIAACESAEGALHPAFVLGIIAGAGEPEPAPKARKTAAKEAAAE
jgi:hypothetical protein